MKRKSFSAKSIAINNHDLNFFIDYSSYIRLICFVRKFEYNKTAVSFIDSNINFANRAPKLKTTMYSMYWHKKKNNTKRR